MSKVTAAFFTTVFAAALTPIASHAGHQGCNWPMYGHDPGHSSAQSTACTQINTATWPP